MGKFPISFGPTGINPALDENPPRGPNVIAMLGTCLTISLIVIFAVIGFLIYRATRPQASAAPIPTVAVLPSQTVTATASPTLDDWSATGTAMFLATHTPTPTPTVPPSATWSLEGWSATGTAWAMGITPEVTPEPSASAIAELTEPPTYTPYPTYTFVPPSSNKQAQPVVTVIHDTVPVTSPPVTIKVTQIVPVPVLRTVIVQATRPPVTATPSATITPTPSLTITPTPTITLTPSASPTVTRDAAWWASATAYYGILTQNAIQPTATAQPTDIPTDSPVDTDVPPTEIPPTDVIPDTPSPTATATDTETPTLEPTITPSETATDVPTETPTDPPVEEVNPDATPETPP